ncbi:MAG: MBL fold metallo-hydrolase [Anaerolineae bacterium]|nr:MBL fold metallo-hydrolase [Anaerolineae bacterium]
MLRIGDLEVHLINDGLMWLDAGGVFGLVPRVLWSQFVAADENNLVPMTLHCLALRAGGKTIIVDTGLGDKLSPKMRAIWHLQQPEGRLLDGLARLGIRPEEVDLVINTHLHADHCGGNTRFDQSGAVVPVFPNAEYVVQRREYEDALHPNERTRATYFPVNYQPLAAAGQLRLLEREQEELAPGVFAVRTPGHTPGHMSVRLESGGEQALFVCDLATLAVHFVRLGWMTAYDVEPLVTLETKRRWTRWALEHNALLIFSHDSQIAAGRLIQAGDGLPEIVPVSFPRA